MEAVQEVIEFLSKNSPNLTDDAFGRILGNLDHLPSLKIINSLQIQAALSNDYQAKNGLNKAAVNTTTILKNLSLKTFIKSTNCVDWQNIECLAIIVHGPLTEKERMDSPLTRLNINPNNHWSLLAWFIKPNTIYHFDSIRPQNHGFNRKKAESIVNFGIEYSLFPQDISSLIEPVFFPLQKGAWECGYHVLIVLEVLDQCDLKFIDLQTKINSLKTKIESITKADNFIRSYFLVKMTDKMLFIQMDAFKEECGLPAITVNKVARILYVSSAVSHDWHVLYESIFGKTKRPLPSAAINKYWDDGIQIRDWASISKLIDEIDFSELTVDDLKDSSKDMNNFIELISPASPKGQYDALKLIKAYMVVHQKRALILLSKVLENRLDLQTKVKLKEYQGLGSCKPDRDTLKLILSFVK